MRFIAVFGALFLALVALLGGLAFWAAAGAMMVMPALERSPILFMPEKGLLGFFFVMAAVFAGFLLLAYAYEVVGLVMDNAFRPEAPQERQTPPSLQILEGGRPAPPPA